MKTSIIMPLPKSPYPARIGPKRWADWYRGCQKAVEIQKSLAARGIASEMLVLSDAHYTGARPEAEEYAEALEELGAEHIGVVRDCYETVGQIEQVLEMARTERKHLVIVSTWLHYLRVWWLLRGSSGVEHHAAFGIPHWKYAFADIVLTVAFPLIDAIPGGRARFMRYAEKKRKEGKYQ